MDIEERNLQSPGLFELLLSALAFPRCWSTPEEYTRATASSKAALLLVQTPLAASPQNSLAIVFSPQRVPRSRGAEPTEFHRLRL